MMARDDQYDDGFEAWRVIDGARKRYTATGQPLTDEEYIARKQDAEDFIREAAMSSFPPAAEAAADRVMRKYEPWPTVIGISIIVTAIAAAGIFVLLLLGRKA